MTPWTFWDYMTEERACPIRGWLTSQGPDVQVALDASVDILEITDDWERPKIKQFEVLTKAHIGLSEIRFWDDGRIFRAAGLYRPVHRDFIFFTACQKERKGLVYTPANAFDRALRMRQDFLSGKGQLLDH